MRCCNIELVVQKNSTGSTCFIERVLRDNYVDTYIHLFRLLIVISRNHAQK